MGDTRERILLTALKLFAADGYEAVSIRQIAESLGMTKAAIYKHYQSKRDIFDSIVARMEQRDAEQARAFLVPEGTLAQMETVYRETAPADILAYSKAQFRYWTEDAFSASFRKLLTLEQYRSREMSELYQQYLVAGPLGYMTDLLSSMGIAEPREKAVAYYAPMYFLYSLYDGTEEKTKVTALLEAHLETMAEMLRHNGAQFNE